MKKTEELWHPIQYFEPYFEVSNHGRVRNILTGEMVEPFILYRYKAVRLEVYGWARENWIYSMVGEYFVENPDPDNLHYVTHINNRLNDYHGNLKWVSHLPIPRYSEKRDKAA